MLGADGRVSIGNYIMNRASNKIAPLAEYIFLCRSGSAPDTQVISDNGEKRGCGARSGLGVASRKPCSHRSPWLPRPRAQSSTTWTKYRRSQGKSHL